MFRCNFCRSSVSHISKVETRRGWGFITISTTRQRGDPIETTIVHCPLHGHRFIRTVLRVQRARTNASARRILREVSNVG